MTNVTDRQTDGQTYDSNTAYCTRQRADKTLRLLTVNVHLCYFVYVHIRDKVEYFKLFSIIM